MWCIAQHTDPTTGAVTWQVRLTDTPDEIVASGLPDRGAAMTRVGEMLAGALVAAAPDAPVGPRFEASFEEGEEARDGTYYRRVIDPGATNFDRPLPIPLMATDETSWGHDGAVLVGAITEATRSGTSTVQLAGRFDTSQRALEFARQVDDGMLTRHSPDLIGPVEDEFECTEYDEDWGWCDEGIYHFVKATLGGTTIVPFPALDNAMITLPDGLSVVPASEVGDAVAASGDALETVRVAGQRVLVAAATVARPEAPFPAAWFDDPQLDAPTALTVGDDGRLSGHIALWGTCHIGMQDQCVTPPRSESGYAYAHTGAPVELDNGTRVRVGHLTVGTGHAPLRGVDPDQAVGHYDDTGFSSGLLRFGEDEHGIWGAGVVDPNATDEQVWAMRVAATSGDWRRIGGSLELVAVLAVNVPGFPIPDTVAASAAGECVALVAAGARGMARLAQARPQPAPPASIAVDVATVRRLEAIERFLAPEMAKAAMEFDGRLDRSPLGQLPAPAKRRLIRLARQRVTRG